MKFTKYKATIFNPISPEETEVFWDGALVISKEGVIAFCGDNEKAPEFDDCEIVDYSGRIIMPGFVDTHCHVGQARAANLRYSQLLPWLNKVVFPLEIAYTKEVAAVEAPKFFEQLLSFGTTTAGTYVTVSEQATDQVFKAAQKSGIRGVIGKVMMDRFSPDGLLEDTDESLASSIRLCEKWNNKELGRLRYAFTPRFALTCSKELMEESGKAAKSLDAHVMTHVAENLDEIKRAKELFPNYRSYLDIYDSLGLLGQKTILAHAIHMDQTDWDVVKERGAGIAHCPTSNLLLESGILDLTNPMIRNIGVGLGSDIGAGSEPALAMVAASAVTSQSARKVLGKSHRNISAQLALYLLTLGGAKAMGLDRTIGNLEKEKEADFLIVDPRPCLPLHEWTEKSDLKSLIWAIILRFRPKAIEKVYVKGKQVSQLTN